MRARIRWLYAQIYVHSLIHPFAQYKLSFLWCFHGWFVFVYMYAEHLIDDFWNHNILKIQINQSFGHFVDYCYGCRLFLQRSETPRELLNVILTFLSFALSYYYYYCVRGGRRKHECMCAALCMSVYTENSSKIERVVSVYTCVAVYRVQW